MKGEPNSSQVASHILKLDAVGICWNTYKTSPGAELSAACPALLELCQSAAKELVSTASKRNIASDVGKGGKTRVQMGKTTSAFSPKAPTLLRPRGNLQGASKEAKQALLP